MHNQKKILESLGWEQLLYFLVYLAWKSYRFTYQSSAAVFTTAFEFFFKGILNFLI